MSLDGLDGPRLDEKDCWLRQGDGGPTGRCWRSATVLRPAMLAWNRQSRKSQESRQTRSANFESGRFMVQGLTKGLL
ncbi:hypothetical protein H0E87_031669, partial [Populus deltoides]